MNPLNITLNGQNVSQMTSWAFCSLIVALILWIWSVVVVAKEKTEDPYDRIVWLLIVLILNFLGTLLYFFFGGDAKKTESQKRKSEEDIKRRANDGTL
jgi:Na+/melibiose symporter-like transporter